MKNTTYKTEKKMLATTLIAKAINQPFKNVFLATVSLGYIKIPITRPIKPKNNPRMTPTMVLDV